MKIRWVGPPVLGGFHNNPKGVSRGQIIDTDGDEYVISEVSLRDYLVNGLAEQVHEAPRRAPLVERAVAPTHETAALKVPPEPKHVEAAPVPLDEPVPEPLKTRPPAKRPAPRR